LKKFRNYINTNVLVKSAKLNTANISIKIIAGILISKFIAIFIGPEGMALVGNLRNFLSAIQSFAIAGLYKGVVKFISLFKTNTVELTKTISTVFYLGFFSSIFLAFLCYYNAEYINSLIFLNNDYTHVIKYLALVLPFYALNMFVFSILNGFSKHKILLIINIIGQILGLLVTLLLIWQDNIDGALIAVVITPALNLLITIIGILYRKNLLGSVQISQVSFSTLKNLSP